MTTLVKTYSNGYLRQYTVLAAILSEAQDAAVITTAEDGDVVISAGDEPELWAQAVSLGLFAA